MISRDALVNAAFVASTLCTIVVTGVVVRREFFPQAIAIEKPVKIPEEEWNKLANGGLRFGPKDARLTIVEFIDFECPACSAFHRTITKYRKRHPTEVAVVLQHLPLEEIHPNAMRLAKTVECAAQVGRLEAIQDTIFARQTALVNSSPVQLAALVGIKDTAAFAQCASDSVRTRGVLDGQAAAQRLKIRGTPTLIANRMQFRQRADSAVLEGMLRDAQRK